MLNVSRSVHETELCLAHKECAALFLVTPVDTVIVVQRSRFAVVIKPTCKRPQCC
jgi:hypothetical protein